MTDSTPIPRPEGSPEELTRLLREVERQTPGAIDQLVSLVYEDLKRMASIRMQLIPPWDSLQPTALVNEIFIKLFGSKTPSWADRGHFYHAASRAMRDTLVDRARHALAQKRGGGQRAVPYTEGDALIEESESMLFLADAMDRLKRAHPRPATVAALKLFVGLSEEQIARSTDSSSSTVNRDWAFARAWLAREMRDHEAS